MSRGLGRVQQAVLAALRRRGGYADLRTLLVDIYYPQDPDDPVDARTHHVIYRAPRRRNVTVYNALQRAVVQLERQGLVQTEVLTVNARAVADRHERRWKTVQLVERGGPAMLITPLSWSQWLVQEGYTLVEEGIRTTAGYTLAQWQRDHPPHPYLLAVVGQYAAQEPLLLPCTTSAQRDQLMQWMATTNQLHTADGGWDVVQIRQILQQG